MGLGSTRLRFAAGRTLASSQLSVSAPPTRIPSSQSVQRSATNSPLPPLSSKGGFGQSLEGLSYRAVVTPYRWARSMNLRTRASGVPGVMGLPVQMTKPRALRPAAT